MVCGSDQLCSGLEAGIEGAIHAMRDLWGEMANGEEEWGILPVDARNGFNELNRYVMLWATRCYWPGGARFAFNCYRRWSQLVVRGGIWLSSMEGVTQGDPLSMVLYGIGLLPLVHTVKGMGGRQCWYADDSALAGTFGEIGRWMDALEEKGPSYRYFPEPSKSILLVHPMHREKAENVFRERKFKVRSGHRYLGGFVGEQDDELAYYGDKIAEWRSYIARMGVATTKYPQSLYAGVSKSLQHEWMFTHRTAAGIDHLFATLESKINGELLPSLFGTKRIDHRLRRLLALPIRYGGIAIPDPATGGEARYRSSRNGTKLLIEAIIKGEDLNVEDHGGQMRMARSQARNETNIYIL